MAVARGISSRINFGSSRGRNSIVPPDTSTVLVATKSPWVWNTGSAWISTSSGVKRQYALSVRAFEARFSWESIAPFERPVVPEV